MYAVEIFMDSDIEGNVRKKWEGLSEEDITSNMIDMDIRPHITLAVYENLPEIEFHELFNEFNERLSKININLDILGTFPFSGTIFMSPTVTTELLDLHNEFHKYFHSYNSLCNEYYLPGKWNSHCH